MSEPVAGRDLAWLERRRAELFGLISQAGDFRRGALNAVWRKCGKPNCACARPGHRGHGPQWNLTRRVGGKTVNVHLKPGPELEKVRREVAEHQRFADLVEEVTAVSEAICAARPVGRASGVPSGGGGKGGLLTGLRGDRRRRGGRPWPGWPPACSAQARRWGCWRRRCAPRWPRPARGCWKRCWPATMTGMPARTSSAPAAIRRSSPAAGGRRSPRCWGRCG